MVNTSINPFVGRIAASCARSLLAYHCGMSRRSLVGLLATRLSPQAGKSLVMRGSLRCSRDTVGRSPPVREREAASLPAPNASHRRVQLAIPQNRISSGVQLRVFPLRVHQSMPARFAARHIGRSRFFASYRGCPPRSAARLRQAKYNAHPAKSSAN